jgi:hypothetical protein
VSTDDTARSSLSDDARESDGPEATVEISDSGDLLGSCESDGVSIVASIGPQADRDAVEDAVSMLRDELSYYAGGIDD